MSISTIGLVVWFLLYGINYFAGIKAIGIILAIIAIIIAVALVLERGRVRRGLL